MSIRSTARAEIARARRLAERAGPPPAELRRTAALVEAHPEIVGASERFRAAPPGSPDAAAARLEVLAILAGSPGDLDEAMSPPPIVVVELAPAIHAAPGPDPIEVLRDAAGRALARRRASDAPLPMETARLYHGPLLAWLAAYAPGAAFADPTHSEDGWGPAHRAWRERYPRVAETLDRLWMCDPHSSAFAAVLCELIDTPETPRSV